MASPRAFGLSISTFSVCSPFALGRAFLDLRDAVDDRRRFITHHGAGDHVAVRRFAEVRRTGRDVQMLIVRADADHLRIGVEPLPFRIEFVSDSVSP